MVNTRGFFYFYFSRLFPAGCPGLIPFLGGKISQVGPLARIYSILKNKKYDEFSKTMQGASQGPKVASTH